MANAIVENASKNANFSGLIGMDAGYLRTAIAQAIKVAFDAGVRAAQK